jgi:hypothetical protein
VQPEPPRVSSPPGRPRSMPVRPPRRAAAVAQSVPAWPWCKLPLSIPPHMSSSQPARPSVPLPPVDPPSHEFLAASTAKCPPHVVASCPARPQPSLCARRSSSSHTRILARRDGQQASTPMHAPPRDAICRTVCATAPKHLLAASAHSLSHIRGTSSGL